MAFFGKKKFEEDAGIGRHLNPPKAAAKEVAKEVAPVVEPAPAAPAPSIPPVVDGGKLVVGPNIRLTGSEITDCDTVIVEGRVEATVDGRVMEISQTGTFSGTVAIDIAEIRGQFEGELTVRRRLTVCGTGKVSGKIRYGTLVVEEGGELSGDIAALGSAGSTTASRPAGAASPASLSSPTSGKEAPPPLVADDTRNTGTSQSPAPTANAGQNPAYPNVVSRRP